MSMSERYRTWSVEQQNLFLLGWIGLLGSACCCFLILIPEVGLGGPLGFLVGSIAEVFSYYSIIFTSRSLLSPEQGKSKNVWVTVLMMVARFLLIIGVLILGGFSTFRWHSRFFCFWTVMAALLPVYPLIGVRAILNKGKKKDPSSQPADTASPSEKKKGGEAR